MTVDLDILKRWIGREQEFMDIVADQPVYALEASLNKEIMIPKIGDPVMPGAHWLFFQEIIRTEDLSTDGHLKRGAFLPPVSLPRRVWTGGRLRFIRDLKIGDQVTRKSVITDVCQKSARDGEVISVMVRHEISDDHGVCIWEEQDIDYCPKPDRWAPPTEAYPRPAMPTWTQSQVVNAITLFRYSALTFNAHRIHYDYPYARDVEGYPGLVVHASLVATILMDFAKAQMQKALTSFSFKSRVPLFDNRPFELEGLPGRDSKTADLWVLTAEGGLAMEAEAHFDNQVSSKATEENEKLSSKPAEAAQHLDMSMRPTVTPTWETPDQDDRENITPDPGGSEPANW